MSSSSARWPLLAALLLLAGARLIPAQSAQVFIDPVDGVRKVRMLATESRSNAGIQWGLTPTGRTVAYDSNREYQNAAGEERGLRVYPFVQWGTVKAQEYPENPVDPYGFIFQESIDENGMLTADRAALRWKDYELAVEASIAMIETLMVNPATLSEDEDGRPVATTIQPGTTITFTISPVHARLDSTRESGESPIGITSATLIAAATKAIGQNQNPNVQGPNGGPALSDTRAAAEWYYFYDQVHLWKTYVEDKILDQNIGGDELMTLVPDELGQRVPQFYEEVLSLRDSIGEQESEENRAFYARLEGRRLRREEYREWQQRDKEDLYRFADEQARQIAGREVSIEGQAFIVVPEPLYSRPEEMVDIVTPSGLITPYDILTSEGDVRKAYRVE